MTVFSYSQLEGLWVQAGGAPSKEALMAAIAEAESSGNSTATGGVGEEGLWQINPAAWPGWATYDPLGNAKAAVHVLATQGLGAWSTYNNGDYKKFLQSGTTPSNAPVSATTTGINPITIPGTNIPLPIPNLGSGAASIFDPNTWLKDIGQTILNSLGLSSMKDLFQRLGLILLGAVIMLIGVSMLTRNLETKAFGGQPGMPQSSPSPDKEEPETLSMEAPSTQALTPAEREASVTTGAGAAGTSALSGEALEAAMVALWLALLSTLSVRD